MLIAYPVDEKSLYKFNDFQCYQQTDWNDVVKQNYKCQEVVSKVAGFNLYNIMLISQLLYLKSNLDLAIRTVLFMKF